MRFNPFSKRISRRQFLKQCGAAALAAALSPILIDILFPRKKKTGLLDALAADETRGMREAMYYTKLDSKYVQCQLCPRRCTLTDGQRSFCRVRQPKGGKLYTLVYGLSCAVHVDPIEKKPLFHVLPASQAFSIATAGCNLRCKFCQNWQISQSPPEDTDNTVLLPNEVVRSAIRSGCRSIAYTYTEPTIFYEYMIETAKLAKQQGIINLYHTGGFINPKPAEELTNYLDAANVDLKGFNKDYLSSMCQEDLDVVLATLKTLKQNGVWVEITNLIVPAYNDNMDEILQMAKWINQNLGPDTPVHFSRFWPQYKLKNHFPTPVETLQQAREKAQEAGLRYCYIGNVPGHEGESTYCPSCKKLIIGRIGYSIKAVHIKDGRCKFCNTRIAGIWQ